MTLALATCDDWLSIGSAPLVAFVIVVGLLMFSIVYFSRPR